MAQVLILKSSILGAHSQSNALIDVIAINATETNVVIRDLAENPLPIELLSNVVYGDHAVAC